MILRALDLILISVMVVLAWRCLNDRDLFRAMIKFVALGLLVAVAWVRLRAPDVALAEAAVGSGLTGALILSALVRMRTWEKLSPGEPSTFAVASLARRFGIGVLSLVLLVALTWGLVSLPSQPAGLTAVALANLPEAGVMNPVTAVLLNYRGYDTLLEIGVLLLAIIGVWSLRRGEAQTGDLRNRPLLISLLRMLLPILVVSAGYLLWIGSFAPGGAFQSGALLGGAFVLALLAGLATRFLQRPGLLRFGVALGVLVFAIISAVTKLITGGMLQYPAGQGGVWILVIESAAVISIGLTLGLLYLGGRPAPDEKQLSESSPRRHA